jgi:hypothetical protein
MQGNQGLNALAALCGGVTKASDDPNSPTTQQFPQSQPTPHASNTARSGNLSLQQFAMAMAQHNPGQDDTINSSNPKTNAQGVPQASQFNPPVPPNLATLFGTGYGQQFSSNNSADSTNALQLAYLNILQNQTPQFVPGGNTNSSIPFVDPSTMALLLRTQQQAPGKLFGWRRSDNLFVTSYLS